MRSPFRRCPACKPTKAPARKLHDSIASTDAEVSTYRERGWFVGTWRCAKCGPTVEPERNRFSSAEAHRQPKRISDSTDPLPTTALRGLFMRQAAQSFQMAPRRLQSASRAVRFSC